VYWIKKADEYQEAVSHLKSYKKAYSSFQKINELETSHNKLVSEIVGKFEDDFINEIREDQNIKIKQHSESREFEKFFMEKIVEYYKTKPSSNIQLKKHYDYFYRNGKHHSRIHTYPTISDLAIGDSMSIDAIYELILKYETSILPTFKQIKDNFDSLEPLVVQFMTDIKEAIHETDRGSLRGKCVYEYGFFPNNITHRFKSTK
jgi:hypothetical protein